MLLALLKGREVVLSSFQDPFAGDHCVFFELTPPKPRTFGHLKSQAKSLLEGSGEGLLGL